MSCSKCRSGVVPYSLQALSYLVNKAFTVLSLVTASPQNGHIFIAKSDDNSSVGQWGSGLSTTRSTTDRIVTLYPSNISESKLLTCFLFEINFSLSSP
jgi:hypothetical protein